MEEVKMRMTLPSESRLGEPSEPGLEPSRGEAPPKANKTDSPTDAEKSAALQALVAGCGLNRREIAALLECNQRALSAWLLPVENKGHREPPAMALELLRLKINPTPPAANAGQTPEPDPKPAREAESLATPSGANLCDPSAPDPNPDPEPARAEEPRLSPAPPRGRLDSPLRTLLGLIVLWASLLLIFTAHQLSDSPIHLAVHGLQSLSHEHSVLEALDPQTKLLLPFSMYFRNTSPREALASIAAHPDINFKLREGTLDQIDGKVKSLRFENVPLYQIVHGLLPSNGRYGFALQGRDLLVFKQQIETQGLPGPKPDLTWQAELALTRSPLLIVPSGKIDLWFAVTLKDEFTPPGPQPAPTVQVGVWKGTELLSWSKARLDEKGNAQLSMSTRDNIAFSITRTEEPQGDKPGLYNLQMHYQSFE